MIKALQQQKLNQLFTVLALLINGIMLAQTPVALPTSSPYTQNFNTTPGASGTSYPSGWTSYNGSTADATMVTGTATSTAGANYNYNSRIGLLGSGSAFLPSSIVLAITNTTGKTGLTISYNVIKIREQGRSNTFNLEVSTTSATSGFTAVTGGTYDSASIAEGTSTAYNSISLPASVENHNGTVWIRWYYNDAGGSGSRDGIALDNVSLAWAPSSVAPTFPTGAATAAFNYGTGGSYDFSVAGTPSPTLSAALNPSGTLPAGITLDTVNTEIDVAGTVAAGTYNIRITATNTGGTATKDVTITVNPVVPTVTTTAFNNQNDADTDSAELKGGVTSNGSAAITARGFIWNTTGTNLTVGQTTTVVNTDPADTDESFSEIITGLAPNTRYYYTAYATNSAGTNYGTVNNFYTHAATPGAPTVSNASFNTLDVSVNNNGNPDATQYVIRVIVSGNTWYVNSSGSLQDTETWLAGSTLVNKTVSGLSPGTNYVFDVKARNASGIETPWSTTTQAQTLAPSTPYFSLTESDLEFGEVCINTSGTGYFTFVPNNIPNNQQIAIFSLDGFSYSLTENGTYSTGLFITYTGQASITVYVKFTPTEVKQYPDTVNGVPGTININSANTSTLSIPVYGEGVNTPAAAVAGASSGVTTTSANVSGQIISGCSAITAYGIEYSTTSGFGNGSGTQVAGANLSGSDFSVSLTGLTGCKPYYYKAYVTDATGTYYSTEQTFTTQTLAAPVANDATDVLQTSFTANWDAVEGATGYYLDVSTSPNFETVYLTEDFSAIIGVEPAQDSNIASTINTYTSTPGWSGQALYRPETGNLKMGTSGGMGYITTPTVNISANGGTATLSFRAKYHSTDSGKTIKVMHAANGSTFTQTGTDITPGQDFTTYTMPLTGGTANSKIRITAATATSNRFHVDDIKIYYSQTLANYTNVAVSGTSHEVTGITPNTTYYYRVRAYGGCTSANSNTTSVQTLKYLELVNSDAAFGDVCTNAEAIGSFTFNGFAMTNANLTVNAVSGYSYSLTEEGTYTPTLTISNYNGGNITVYVKFNPSAVQSYNGTITVSGEAGSAYEAATLEIPVTGAGIYTPAVATAGAATDLTMVSATVAGQSTEGNCSATTAYGIEYSTTANFENGSGTQIPATNIDGNGNYSISLTGLTACTTYYYKAYTTTAESTIYSTQQQFTTTAITAPVAIAASDITEGSFTANWEAVDNAAGYRIDVATNPVFETYNPGTTNTETFTSMPASNSSYANRTWTGDNGVGWQATDARTDQTITDRAILLRVSSLTNTTAISGGLSKISFKYKRVFTGNSVLKVFINGTQYGGDIAVSSDQPSEFVLDGLNIQGDINFELRNTGGTSSRTAIDDLALTSADQSASYYVTGYEDRNVAGGSTTSLAVTGLTELTIYYYRVRAYTANCTTANSNTISVGTKGTVTWKEVNGTAKWMPEYYTDGVTSVVIDNTTPVVIEANYNTGTNGVFAAKSITVNSGTFTIASGTSLTVEDEVVNNAPAENFVIENNGNLLQINTDNSLNDDAVTVYRDSSPLYRQDYTMWSSPVTGQNIFGFSPVTLANRFYTYNPATDQFNTVPGLGESSNTEFAVGTGYLIRMPNSGADADGNPTGTTSSPAEYQLGSATMVYNGKFTGVPNNGTISVPLSGAGNGFNLIGNPYPSPINISQFLSANQDVINGTIWVWRKTNASNNTAYCTINRTGQYVDNGEPNTGTNPSAIIRTGQGFIVQMNANPAGSAVTFSNSMRSTDTSNQFFRNGNHSAGMPESHGIYLNLTNSNGFYSQMYTGYIEGATEGADNGIDSKYINDKPTVLSTVLNGSEYIINGRALPFSSQNTEPLQLRTAQAGTYTIAIGRTEGLFSTNQEVFIKDNLAGVTHNLKQAPYIFSTEAGTFAGRFEIVYQAPALGIHNPVPDDNAVMVYKEGSNIMIDAGTAEMKTVVIFDMRGRMIYNNSNVDATTLKAENLQAEQQVLLVQITTKDNAKVSRKIIF
jgi:hypothetical protein